MAARLSKAQERTIEAPEIDIRQLLECACEHFLPGAYRALLGREPDAIGAMHYARRLRSRVPRQLILAEMRTSRSGQEYASQAPSQALDRLVSRYRRVRSWPIGRLRWWFLPRFCGAFPDDGAFQWERWANDYTSQWVERRASERTASPQSHEPGNPSVERQIQDLRDKVERLTTALEASVSALRASGEPEQVVRPLSEALSEARFEAPDPEQVSWEARQYLHVLLQALRT